MSKRMSVVLCGLAVTLMTAGSASAQTATQDAKDKTKAAGNKTAQAGKDVGSDITDAAVTASVKTKFLADTKVSGLNINVDTSNHVVTLTGVVHSAAEKAEALRLARETNGVKSVISKLTVEPVKTADNDTKTAAKADAHEAKADAKGTAGHVKAETKDKAADVKADTKEKSADAAHKAGAAKADVKDAGADAKDATTDAAITSAVKTKLLADSTVGGLKIDVDTTNHVVTLSGPVHSAAEKAEAVRLAKATKGVKSVVSKLTIEPKQD
jgi:osmotically-inducible protein OsmY